MLINEVDLLFSNFLRKDLLNHSLLKDSLIERLAIYLYKLRKNNFDLKIQKKP